MSCVEMDRGSGPRQTVRRKMPMQQRLSSCSLVMALGRSYWIRTQMSWLAREKMIPFVLPMECWGRRVRTLPACHVLDESVLPAENQPTRFSHTAGPWRRRARGVVHTPGPGIHPHLTKGARQPLVQRFAAEGGDFRTALCEELSPNCRRSHCHLVHFRSVWFITAQS
jgi:hypothetical protein